MRNREIPSGEVPGQMVDNEAQKNNEGSSRREFLKELGKGAGLIGGFSVAVGAAGYEVMKRVKSGQDKKIAEVGREIESLPFTDIKQLLSNPEQFAAQGQLRTVGYMQKTGKREAKPLNPMPTNMFQYGYEQVNKGQPTRYTYRIHEGSDMSGPGMDVAGTLGEVGEGVKEVVGRLVKMKNRQGEEKFFFEVRATRQAQNRSET